MFANVNMTVIIWSTIGWSCVIKILKCYVAGTECRSEREWLITRSQHAVFLGLQGHTWGDIIFRIYMPVSKCCISSAEVPLVHDRDAEGKIWWYKYSGEIVTLILFLQTVST